MHELHRLFLIAANLDTLK